MCAHVLCESVEGWVGEDIQYNQDYSGGAGFQWMSILGHSIGPAVLAELT